MCTVTAVSHPGSLRIVMNRDELRTRPAGRGPTLVRTGSHQSIMPIDPLSGGTWIGCNHAGLAAVLLNMAPGTQPHTPREGDRSRGSIIPAILTSGTVAQAAELATELPADRYPPFRLLLATIDQYTLLSSCRDTVAVLESGPLDRPLMLASSGLGDDLVQPFRHDLLQQMISEKLGSSPLSADAQDRFHRTPCDSQPHVGVLMHRDDARTVSITTLTLTADWASMQHTVVTDDGHLEPHTAEMPVRSPVAPELIP